MNTSCVKRGRTTNFLNLQRAINVPCCLLIQMRQANRREKMQQSSPFQYAKRTVLLISLRQRLLVLELLRIELDRVEDEAAEEVEAEVPSVAVCR